MNVWESVQGEMSQTDKRDYCHWWSPVGLLSHAASWWVLMSQSGAREMRHWLERSVAESMGDKRGKHHWLGWIG